MAYFADFSKFVSWALMLWGAAEAVMGLLQVFGFMASRHSLYALTGTFYNPGPYSGFLAMVLPVCLYEFLAAKRARSRWRKVASAIVALLIIAVLPAGMSRSAWVAAAVACLWVYGFYAKWGRSLRLGWIFERKLILGIIICGVVQVAVLGYLMYVLKPESAQGRLLMWRFTCQAIAEKPWTGHGTGGFAAAYGNEQEAYFAQGQYQDWEEWVAGSPEYAFNEYLQLAVEHGIPVAVAVVAVVCLCWFAAFRKRRIGICGGLLSLMVFAFSSYPFQFPAFVAALAALLAACLVGRIWKGWLAVMVPAAVVGGLWLKQHQRMEEVRDEWMIAKGLYHAGAYGAAEKEYERLYPELGNRGDFLFEYGHGLHKQGKYGDSNRVLEEAMKHSCDPMILNIMGKNFHALNRYEEADKYFRRAAHRVPSRIYPYYLLAKLYADSNNLRVDRFVKMLNIVMTKEPKVQSTAVKEMREELAKLAVEVEKLRIKREPEKRKRLDEMMELDPEEWDLDQMYESFGIY